VAMAARAHGVVDTSEDSIPAAFRRQATSHS
jgi:hypothetical protein